MAQRLPHEEEPGEFKLFEGDAERNPFYDHYDQHSPGMMHSTENKDTPRPPGSMTHLDDPDEHFEEEEDSR
eukprot:CAMPEP_0184496058 /NCGR_PEP_ID=MMETSP0113_2-20130426/33028_1 /TAXON_ID=91329 /ORGANISM="Norrisiella sphaerica, Strain BC52" /LENGTH=70 /DNA_ID=CAMNT_0026882543 /DNA_START=495 /DNA_END=704 /DNA_ORIENTATION=+